MGKWSESHLIQISRKILTWISPIWLKWYLHLVLSLVERSACLQLRILLKTCIPIIISHDIWRFLNSVLSRYYPNPQLCHFWVSLLYYTLHLGKWLNMISLVCLNRNESLFYFCSFPCKENSFIKKLFRMKCTYILMNILHFEKWV